MADNIVGGLFGVDPAALQRQQQLGDQQQAYRYANMDPMQQAKYLQATGAMGLARGVGGLMGMEDPELAKATKIKQISSQIDFSTPDGLRKLGAAIKDFAPQEAMMALSEADKREQTGLGLQKTKADIAKSELSATNEAKMRQELAALPPTATNADRIAILTKYGDPDVMFRALQMSEDKQGVRTAKQEVIDNQRKEAANNILDSAVEGKTLVSSLKQQVGYNTVGIGSALSWIPMTDAKKFSADLATLKSQLTLAAMNAAKSQSKTGATGFGALNSKELKVLQDNIVALDTQLSPDDFNTKLDEVTSYFDKLEKKATGTLQPTGATNAPDTGEFADDYKKYKEKHGDKAFPYNVYVQKRKGQ